MVEQMDLKKKKPPNPKHVKQEGSKSLVLLQAVVYLSNDDMDGGEQKKNPFCMENECFESPS